MYQGDFDTHFVVHVGQYRFQNHDFPLSWCNGESKGLFPTKHGTKWKNLHHQRLFFFFVSSHESFPRGIIALIWCEREAHVTFRYNIKKRRNAKKESLNASLHCSFPFQIPNQHWQFWNGEGIRPCFENQAHYVR